MATKKKAAELAAESVQEPEENMEGSQPQGNAETALTGQETRDGIDLKDTPLGGVEGDLVYVNAAKGLNLRKGPALTFPVAEVLADGSVVAVLALPYGAEVAGWALVHTGQRIGWVDCSFIQALEK